MLVWDTTNGMECAILVCPIAHIFKTSGWNNITFGSQGNIGIIHSFPDFDLGMTPCDLQLFLFQLASN